MAWLVVPVPQANAQAPTLNGKVQLQVANGTKDAKSPDLSKLPVTLYIADMNAQSIVTQTATTDAKGSAVFSNLNPMTSTRYLALARYNNIDYVGEVFSFDAGATTQPITVTVYETTTDSSAIQIAQAHLILDIQTKAMNVTEIIQFTNLGDRTFIGANPIGSSPHRATLLLPTLVGATEILFDDPDIDASTLRGVGMLTYTMPIQPGNDQIIFTYGVVYNPPNYELAIKMPYDVPTLRILMSDVGEKLTSSQLSPMTQFPTQMGANFLQTSMSNIAKGTEIKATITNLPETVAGSTMPTTGTSTTGGAPTTAPADNSQVIGYAVLGAAAIAAIGLIVYPLTQRRSHTRAVETEPVAMPMSKRELLLQSIADLDDDHEAGKVSDATYTEERARLKAKLADLEPKSE